MPIWKLTDAYFNPQVSRKTKIRNFGIIYLFRIEKFFSRSLGLPVPELSLTLSNDSRGLFSLLSGFIDLIEYSIKMNLNPNVFLENINYSSRGVDVIETLFDTEYRTNRVHSKYNLVFQHSEELPFFRLKTSKMNLSRAQFLSQIYLNPSEKIRLIVEEFFHEPIKKSYIGIHWRGTDHFTEAVPVDLEEILEEIQKNLGSKKYAIFEGVFIATDEKVKLETLSKSIRARHPNLEIAFTNSSRSDDGIPIHLRSIDADKTNKFLGQEALIDCLLLSKSSTLIRVPSNLSAWCKVFNPELNSVLLGKHNAGIAFYEWRWMY